MTSQCVILIIYKTKAENFVLLGASSFPVGQEVFNCFPLHLVPYWASMLKKWTLFMWNFGDGSTRGRFHQRFLRAFFVRTSFFLVRFWIKRTKKCARKTLVKSTLAISVCLTVFIVRFCPNYGNQGKLNTVIVVRYSVLQSQNKIVFLL